MTGTIPIGTVLYNVFNENEFSDIFWRLFVLKRDLLPFQITQNKDIGFLQHYNYVILATRLHKISEPGSRDSFVIL